MKIKNKMKIYIWTGSGVYLGATLIVTADCLKSAKELIEKKLIDSGLHESWIESEEITELEIDDCKIIYFDNGDY